MSLSNQIEKLQAMKDELYEIDLGISQMPKIDKLLDKAAQSIDKAITAIIVSDEYQEELAKAQDERIIEAAMDSYLEDK